MSSKLREDAWVELRPPAHGVATARLFVLAHAGAGVRSYVPMAAQLPRSLEVVGLELPGRGGRAGEPLSRSLLQVSGELAELVSEETDLPALFFGHSIGAQVAFEIVRQLESEGSLQVDHLIVSAKGAPSLSEPARRLAAADDETVLTELAALGGTDSAVLASPLLRTWYLPIVRADFALLSASAHAGRVDCPLTAVAANDDARVAPEAVSSWSEHAAGEFRYLQIEGGHFYCLQQPEVAASLISNTLPARPGVRAARQ
jgi:pyochelin biosynthetic protein PchC